MKESEAAPLSNVNKSSKMNDRNWVLNLAMWRSLLTFSTFILKE